MNLSPHKLAEIARVAEEIRAIVGDDETALIDTLDGETDVMDIIGAVLREIDEASAAATGSAERRDHYAERVRAMKERDARLRLALVRVLEAIGEKSIRHDLATVGISAGKPSLILEDGIDWPDDLAKITRTPDKTAIRKRLEEGHEVVGAMLGNAAPVLRIRSK